MSCGRETLKSGYCGLHDPGTRARRSRRALAQWKKYREDSVHVSCRCGRRYRAPFLKIENGLARYGVVCKCGRGVDVLIEIVPSNEVKR